MYVMMRPPSLACLLLPGTDGRLIFAALQAAFSSEPEVQLLGNTKCGVEGCGVEEGGVEGCGVEEGGVEEGGVIK